SLPIGKARLAESKPIGNHLLPSVVRCKATRYASHGRWRWQPMSSGSASLGPTCARLEVVVGKRGRENSRDITRDSALGRKPGQRATSITIMHKVNTKDIAEVSWSSPKGKFEGAGMQVSEALGRKPLSTDIRGQHPFDIEILRISPGKTPYPHHSH